MIALAGKRRSLRVFWVLLVVACVFLVLGVVDRQQEGAGFLREGLASVGSWVSRPFVALGQWFSGTWSNLANLSSLGSEVEQLRKERAELESKLALLEEARQENEALRGFLQVKQTVTASQTVVASILMNEPSPYTRSVLINVGEGDGIKRRMPVLADTGGLLGQIIEVSATKSRVLLINDLNSAVSGKIQRTGEVAVVKGDGQDGCALERLAKETSMQAGDTVVTSGMGGIFPPGLLIGKISEVRQRGALYLQAVVKPSADLGAIRFVMVLKTVE
ncbi:MAG: rod shape-determining protein MreC [bacterium]